MSVAGIDFGSKSNVVALARRKGIDVVMNRCPKIEYARLCGEIGWSGVASNVISSKKPKMGKGFHQFGIVPGRQ